MRLKMMTTFPTSFPRQLDGATVLYSTEAKREAFSHETEFISYYALAQYSGDEPRVYLFCVSAEFEVIGDFLEDSINDAMETAEVNSSIAKGDWVKIRP